VHVTVVLFDQLTPLDAIGPYEALIRMPDARVELAAMQAGPITTSRGPLKLIADRALSELERTDLLLVPGGPGTRALEQDAALLAELRRLAAGARIVASVCTGALLLGAAGLLRGRRATTHWALVDRLAEFGATPIDDARVVVDRELWTGAGVSAGIDLALHLIAALHGRDLAEAVQLGMEYDPQPPFASGSVATAAPELVARLRAGIVR
jgi:transcriptional regulator GlxA family with amidase domain